MMKRKANRKEANPWKPKLFRLQMEKQTQLDRLKEM
jgi:hypothetical protein